MDTDAVGKLKVCVEVTELIAKSVPLVPTAKVCVNAVNPFKLVMPVSVSISLTQAVPLYLSTCPLDGVVIVTSDN